MVSENIKRLRRAAKMSQTEFAKRVHVTQGAVSQWENGLTRPDTEQVRIIARELGVSVNDILGDVCSVDIQLKNDLPGPGEIDGAIAALSADLTPEELQLVIAYAEGIKAARKA